MTGIRLMQTGEVEANLRNLNTEFRFAFVDDLIASKTSEKIAPDNLDWNFHAKQLDQLEQKLTQSFEDSKLSEHRDREAVNRFLVQLRLVPSN